MKKTIDQLMAEAHELLESCDYTKAIKIGKQLLTMRHSSGFEILAKAYYEDGKFIKAIKILEEGCEKAPIVPVLWLLLGNFYSESNKFREAIAAYEKGLKLQNSDKIEFQFNYAIALERAGDFAGALKLLDKVPNCENPIDAIRKDALSAGLNNKLGNFKEAISIADKAIKKHSKAIDDKKLLSDLFIEKGFGTWKLYNKKAEAISLVEKAVECDRNSKRAMWFYRDILGAKSEKANYWYIMLQAKWPIKIEFDDGKLEDANYFTTYDAVADDLEEVLEFIKLFEPKEVHSSIRIEESKILKKKCTQPKGVYKTIGYIFYPRSEDKKRKIKNKSNALVKK